MFSGVRGIVSRPSVVMPRSISPSRRYRSVKASAKTRFSPSMSRSTAGSGPVTRASGSHARIGWSQGGGIVAHDARPCGGVVRHANDAVEPVAHLFDVRDENDLGETIAQTAQEREYVLAP